VVSVYKKGGYKNTFSLHFSWAPPNNNYIKIDELVS
jgi:hypothetical protein